MALRDELAGDMRFLLLGSHYWTIRLYPDMISDEHVNIGVIGYGNGGTQAQTISDTAWYRVANFFHIAPQQIAMHRNALTWLVETMATEEAMVAHYDRGRGVYTRVWAEPQGSSVEDTAKGLPHFFAKQCRAAEGHDL